MPSLTITTNTSATPEQFLASLTNFGPERAQVWGNSQPNYLIVHAQTTTSADVTEGSSIFGGVWERLNYDWYDPLNIVLTTTDGNFWATGSGWSYQLTATATGCTIRATVTRYPKNIGARVTLLFIGTLGRPLIHRDFTKTLRKIENHA